MQNKFKVGDRVRTLAGRIGSVQKVILIPPDLYTCLILIELKGEESVYHPCPTISEKHLTLVENALQRLKKRYAKQV